MNISGRLVDLARNVNGYCSIKWYGYHCIKWIRGLNRKGYAGYCDWRVPTVEVASSLLEDSEMNGNLYIDTVFDKKQRWIWTSDSCSSGGMWRIYFDDGYVDWGDVGVLFG